MTRGAPGARSGGGRGRADLGLDLRYAARRLRAAPAFTVAVVLVLAIGIGATTTIFSVIDAALLRGLPYPDPERLVALRDLQGEEEVPASFPEYLDWRNADGIASVAAYFTTTLALTGEGEPEMLQVAQMAATLPGLLGVTPILGRSFASGEDEPGAERVAMIGEDLWRARFGADPAILGHSLVLADQAYTIVGVFPRGTGSLVPRSLAQGRRQQVWVPLRLDQTTAPRGLHFLDVVARIDPGLDLATARERIAALSQRLKQDAVTDHGIRLVELDRMVVGESRPLLSALAGAVAMLLLIACSDVANLLLARSTARRREIAVRTALGAARARVLRQLLVESLLLALLGGAAGVLVSSGALAALRSLAAGSVPRLSEAALDARVLLFALGLSIATGLAFGVLPALRATRCDPAAVMKEGTRGSTGGAPSERLRGALIVAEVALSFALLIGAGLLLRSFERLLAVDKGFDPDRVASGFVTLPKSRYQEPERQAAFFADFADRLAALPGVRGAAYVNNLPLDGGVNGGVGIEGREFASGEEPMAEKRIVSPAYFDVLRTPVLAGRAFEARDAAGAPAVAIVNQAFVRRFLAGEIALGRHVDFAWDTQGFQRIVGVVADVRERGLDQPPAPAIYVPLAQRAESDGYVIVRTAGDPHLLLPELRAAAAAIDPALPVAELRTFDDVVEARLADRRLATTLFGVFSAVSLALAAIGLYAVLSYAVLQRRQEIGIRMALGARAREVVRSVLTQGLALIAMGIALGGAAALLLGRTLSALLFGVGAADPVTFAGVVVVLATTGSLACAVPALRAARLDPSKVLRSE